MKFIVFFWDTMRADHASCYGYPRETTPNLGALAREGFLFENDTSVTGHTGPTFTSYVTGRYPFSHDIITTLPSQPNCRDDTLDDTIPLLPDELRRRFHYLTAAFDNLMLWPSQPRWMVRGNDYYVNTVHPETYFCAAVLAEHINARLLPFIEANKDRDFYIMVHYWDPHQPYNQPEPYRSIHCDGPVPAEKTARDGRRYIPLWGWLEDLTEEHRGNVNLYDGEFTYCDYHFGRVVEKLKSLGIYDDTTVIVTADHGEDMYEHNAPLEHRETYQSTVHVPLVVKPARELNLNPPGRISQLVSPIDILPSVFDMIGEEPPEGLDGASWVPLLRGEDRTLHEYLFSTGSAVVQKGLWRVAELAVRTPTHKLIRRGQAVLEEGLAMSGCSCLGAPPFRRDKSRPLKDRFDYHNALPRVELYDLQADPCEVDNLADDQPELTAKLNALLDEHIARNARRWIENCSS